MCRRRRAHPSFCVALGELRATFCTHIAALAYQYGLDLRRISRRSSRLPTPHRGGQPEPPNKERVVSTVLSVPAIWRVDKMVAVTGHTRHRHNPSSISASFTPSNANTTLIFGPSALAASIARTATLRDAPPEMLARWGNSALTEVEWLVDDGVTFVLSQYVHSLADAERTSFAGRIGAGVTDLLMNALGYTWRDNASSLSHSLAPHADFIYGDGAVSGHGVVLAEAHGSFAANVTSAGISRQAKHKYLRQVRNPAGVSHGVCGPGVYLVNKNSVRELEHKSGRLNLGLKANQIAAKAIMLLLLTGARRSEVTRARWEHVDFEKRTLLVPVSKSGRPRTIALNAAAIGLLRAMLTDSASPYVFPTQLTGLYYPWNRIRRRASLADVRLHDLRHSFASFLMNQGVSLYVVQGLLGHTQARMTQRYAHLASQTLLDAAEVVSGVIRGPSDL